MVARRHLEKSTFKFISIAMECCTYCILLEFLGMQYSILVLFLYFIVPEYLNPRWPQDAILRVILTVPLWVFWYAESYYGVILHFDFPEYFKFKMATRLQLKNQNI